MSAAGALRERIAILSFVSTATDAGDPIETWVEIAANIPARMQPKKSSEFMRAMREVNETRFVGTIRNRPNLSPAMRVIWSGRTFKIDGITNLDERREFLSLELLEISI